MTTRNQNFAIFAGDDKTVRFTITQGGVAVDLSAVQAIRWQAALNAKAATPALSKDLDDGVSKVDGGTGGVIAVRFEPDDTEDLDPGNYYHEVEVTDVDGNISTVATGVMTVKAELIAAEA